MSRPAPHVRRGLAVMAAVIVALLLLTATASNASLTSETHEQRRDRAANAAVEQLHEAIQLAEDGKWLKASKKARNAYRNLDDAAAHNQRYHKAVRAETAAAQRTGPQSEQEDIEFFTPPPTTKPPADCTPDVKFGTDGTNRRHGTMAYLSWTFDDARCHHGTVGLIIGQNVSQVWPALSPPAGTLTLNPGYRVVWAADEAGLAASKFVTVL